MADNSENNNDKANRKSDNTIAILIMVLCFGALITLSILTQEHPFDFIAEFLGQLVAYILLIALVFAIIAVVVFYYRIADEDPNKSLKERARDSLQISKETSSEISQYVRKYYADYQARKNDDANDNEDRKP